MTKDNPNVRELALYVLTEVTDRGEYSNHVLKNVLEKYQYMEKRDRAFLSRLCEGTLEQLIRIDDVLNRFSKVPVKKMKPVIRGILRLGVYQLLFMDSVPDAAVCNESVKLATRKGFYNLKGFVNGVLRSIAREKDKALTVTGTGADYLSVRYSMPLWIVKKWLAVYPEETVERLLAAFLEPAATYIRCNSSRISPEALLERLQKEGAEAVKDGFVPDALRLTRSTALLRGRAVPGTGRFFHAARLCGGAENRGSLSGHLRSARGQEPATGRSFVQYRQCGGQRSDGVQTGTAGGQHCPQRFFQYHGQAVGCHHP